MENDEGDNKTIGGRGRLSCHVKGNVEFSPKQSSNRDFGKFFSEIYRGIKMENGSECVRQIALNKRIYKKKARALPSKSSRNGGGRNMEMEPM